ncbi:tryptophan-rich sensory protein [uncultured Sphaerochaeta sp.]|uniref:tryptophan-rich sensory protein n=1 Tax=uncultured Sphaerochaeta sp. TaxID=886478 RepID=UPI002A0A84CE|nr:tryptophan-rich sensory protein [uncultured Sphaerochaeta sp.]
MKDKQKTLFRQVAVLLSFVCMIIVNALANILPFNGMSTGAISDSYPNLFAPVGFTFAIWGVIYSLLMLYTLYQLGIFQKESKNDQEQLLVQIAPLFIISSLVNALWLVSWHYTKLVLSMVLMLVLLLCLISIVQAIKKHSLKKSGYLCIQLPFSIYFGWITVATIANAATLLVSLGWNRFGLSESFWTVLILIVGMAIGVATAIRNQDIPYILVLVWAYFGILYKHLAANEFHKAYPDIIVTLCICLAIFLICIGYLISQKKARKTIS